MNNDCITKIADVTVNEIFQDALFFQVLYEITVRMDNYEAVVAADRFLKLQSVVFMSELMKYFDEKHIELGIGAEKNEFVRRLNEERNDNGIHYSPIGSDRMKNVIKDMDAGKNISGIAARNGAQEELVEKICRIYSTH